MTPPDLSAPEPEATASTRSLPAAIWVPGVIVILGLLMWVFAR